MALLFLLSNSRAPGLEFLEHALDQLEELFGRRARLLFFAHASSDQDRYATIMEEALAPLQTTLVRAHASADLAAELSAADAVFVGGGNAFRLLRSLETLGLLETLRASVEHGLPYIGASAGSNVACPTIRTTNDMPIVEPRSLAALGLVPFQINPHYLDDRVAQHLGETRDERIAEFLEENDVPVLALREGSWLHVRGKQAVVGGVSSGRLFARGQAAVDLPPGSDVSELLATRPRYDVSSRPEESS
jgi:dipeptidase E